jgi:hypothetical protein
MAISAADSLFFVDRDHEDFHSEKETTAEPCSALQIGTLIK